MPMLLAVLRPSLFGFFFTGSDALLPGWSVLLGSIVVRDEAGGVTWQNKVNNDSVCQQRN